MLARDFFRRALLRMVRGPVGRRLVGLAVSDDVALTRMLNALSDRVADDATFEVAIEQAPGTIEHFEDCAWLLSSNVLNHGVSRLMIDEAAYLFRLVRSLESPVIVEIGRYRGGTTFLLAAAGGHVLSLDVDPTTKDSDAVLRQALERYGFGGSVSIVIADSQLYQVEHSAYDVVFVDGEHSYEGVRADVERWLPGVKLGGHLVLHDAFFPSPRRPWAEPWKVEGVHALREELVAQPGLELVARAGTLAHFTKRAD